MSITTVEIDRTGPAEWKTQDQFGFEEIIYEKADEGIAKITINRPEEGQEGKNAFLEKRKPHFGQFTRYP
jgi:1,4-dihydroxy-2-naphthoyl-CoA synthase